MLYNILRYVISRIFTIALFLNLFAIFQVSVGGVGLARCVASSSNNHIVAVAHSSGIIAALDIRTGQLLASWKQHEGEVIILDITCFSDVYDMLCIL